MTKHEVKIFMTLKLERRQPFLLADLVATFFSYLKTPRHTEDIYFFWFKTGLKRSGSTGLLHKIFIA